MKDNTLSRHDFPTTHNTSVPRQDPDQTTQNTCLDLLERHSWRESRIATSEPLW